MNDITLVQFKLVSGEQIVAEVMQYPDSDTDSSFLLRNCLEVLTITAETMEEYIEYFQSGGRYYLFRPWMMYQDENDMLVAMNTQQVMATAKPNLDMLEAYYETVFAMHNNAHTRKKLLKKERDQKYQEFAKNMKKLLEAGTVDSSETDTSNVIEFPVPPNSTLH